MFQDEILLHLSLARLLFVINSTSWCIKLFHDTFHLQDINKTRSMNKKDKDNIERTKRERTNAKRKFTRKCNAFVDLCERQVPFLVIQEKFDDIRESYKELSCVNDLVALINETAQHDVMDGLLDDCDAYMNDVETTQDQVRILFASHLPDSRSKSTGIRVRPLDAPSFSGNIREYSSFRQDFNRLMVTDYGEDPYALRSCLSGSALDTVRGAEDDFQEMFRRLDNAYGDPRKIVDAVINDVKSLKPIADGESKRFIAMVDTVERSWLDLQRMGLAGEMDTVSMVSMIERLLPTTQKREWVLRIETKHVDSKNMFNELLQFLLQEKRVIAYMDHDLRVTGKFRNVHHSICNENMDEGNDDLRNKLRGLEEKHNAYQEHMVKEMEKLSTCLGHLLQASKMINGGQSFDRVATVSIPSSSKWCWVHGTSAHSIEKCNVITCNMS